MATMKFELPFGLMFLGPLEYVLIAIFIALLISKLVKSVRRRHERVVMRRNFRSRKDA